MDGATTDVLATIASTTKRFVVDGGEVGVEPSHRWISLCVLHGHFPGPAGTWMAVQQHPKNGRRSVVLSCRVWRG